MNKLILVLFLVICVNLKSYADVPDQISQDCKSVIVTDPTGVEAPYTLEDISGKVDIAKKQEMYGFQQVQQAHIVLSYFTPMLNELQSCTPQGTGTGTGG